jgi:hypothetical protein
VLIPEPPSQLGLLSWLPFGETITRREARQYVRGDILFSLRAAGVEGKPGRTMLTCVQWTELGVPIPNFTTAMGKTDVGMYRRLEEQYEKENMLDWRRP